LVRREAFVPARICENHLFPQSTLVSPTRLADRTSVRGWVTLDAVRVFKQREVLEEKLRCKKLRLHGMNRKREEKLALLHVGE